MHFFNKSRFVVSRLSDQIEVEPDVSVTLPLFILDTISETPISLISGAVYKVDGRVVTEVATASVMEEARNSYSTSFIVATSAWDGKVPLTLKLQINGQDYITVPLPVKGYS